MIHAGRGEIMEKLDPIQERISIDKIISIDISSGLAICSSDL